MSIQLVGWALDTPCGSVSRKAVLIALAHAHNHHSGQCNPRLKIIARETDLSVSTVQRAIDGLVEMGLVEKVQRKRPNGSLTSNEYLFPTSPYGHVDHTPQVTVPNLEPEVRTGSKNQPLAPAAQNGHKKPTREQRDAVWDAVTDICGPALTRTAETNRGRIVASLAEAMVKEGITEMGPEVFRRASRWPLHYDKATLTANALEKHWDTLPRKPLRRT